MVENAILCHRILLDFQPISIQFSLLFKGDKKDVALPYMSQFDFGGIPFASLSDYTSSVTN